MKKLLIYILLALVATTIQAAGDLKIWFKSPARAWEEALPVGNGRLGAMVFGHALNERIQFNENTLYSGEPETPLNIDITADYEQVRNLLKEGKNAQAGEIMQKKWIGRLNESYQPFGDLHLDFDSKGTITDYTHTLNLADAIVTTSFKLDGVQVIREVFASYPAQTIIVKLKAEKPILNFTASLTSLHSPHNSQKDKR